MTTSAKESNAEQSHTDSLSRIIIQYIEKSCQVIRDNADYSAIMIISILFFVALRKPDIFGAHQVWRYNLPIAIDHMLPVAVLIIFVLIFVRRGHRKSVYLLDISCFRPADILRVPHSSYVEHAKLTNKFNEESVIFQKRMLERCCVGEQTSFPLCFRYLPPKPSMSAARDEAEAVLFTCVDDLLRKTRVKPQDIGIVVVNCSSFNPSPSLCAMIINRYKLPSNTKTYNLGGMGCSAGVISLDVAKHALLANRNTYAVVVSTENITQNMYWGNDRSMLVSNCLFRVGGSAILLSNKPSDKWRANYRLKHVIRTHKGADDSGYHAAYQVEDEQTNVGVSLSKEIMRVATEALGMNATALGPLVLPYFEQLRFIANLISRNVLKKSDIPTYIPNFKTAFEHFCIHSGGRAVISAVEKSLNLSPVDVEPTRMTLHRFGNTSSSTTWYQFQYLEAKGRIKKGDRIWQLAFGSGFKCNSAVWTALRTLKVDSSNAWSDCIMDYPVSTMAHLDL